MLGYAALLPVSLLLAPVVLAVAFAPELVRRVPIPSLVHRLMFWAFSACTILWFLSPSALATRVNGLLRPAALRLAAQGKHRLAALTFASCEFLRPVTVVLQALFAARLVTSALPAGAAGLVLPALPAQYGLLAGTYPSRFLGPLLGGPTSALLGWMLNLIQVLVSGREWLLALSLACLHGARLVLAATAPRAAASPEGLWRGEAPRTLAAGALLFGALLCGRAAVGHPVPAGAASLGALVYPQIQKVATLLLVASPLARDVVVSAVADLSGKPAPGAVVRGHVGGEFVSGHLRGFKGRYAEVELVRDGGTVHVGAATALGLLRTDRKGSQCTVPAASAASAIQAAKRVLKKKPSRLTVSAGLVILCGLFALPVGFQNVLYGVAVGIYLGKLIIPKPLVITLTVLAFLSVGPVATGCAFGMAVSFVLCSLPARLTPGPVAFCTGLNLASSEATLVWRGDATAEAVRTAASQAECTKAGIDGILKKQRSAGVAKAIAALVTVALCLNFNGAVALIESATASRLDVRFGIFGVCSAISLRLMLNGIARQGVRELPLVPGRLSRAASLPAGAAGWFLAVNVRAALVGAMMGYFFLAAGPLQAMLYRKGVIHQVHFIDAWLFQLSSGFLLSVLLVSGVEGFLGMLPSRPRQPILATIVLLCRAAACAATARGTMMLAAGAVPGLAPLDIEGLAARSAMIAVAAIGFIPPFCWDFVARVFYQASGSLRPGDSVWVAADGAGPPQVARLLCFRQQEAFLRIRNGEGCSVPAGRLWRASFRHVRWVGADIPVPEGRASLVLEAVRAHLHRERLLIYRAPFAPGAQVEAGILRVCAFVDRSVPAAEARRVRSDIFVAAALAAAQEDPEMVDAALRRAQLAEANEAILDVEAEGMKVNEAKAKATSDGSPFTSAWQKAILPKSGRPFWWRLKADGEPQVSLLNPEQ